jgi:hypothetical protein
VYYIPGIVDVDHWLSDISNDKQGSTYTRFCNFPFINGGEMISEGKVTPHSRCTLFLEDFLNSKSLDVASDCSVCLRYKVCCPGFDHPRKEDSG